MKNLVLVVILVASAAYLPCTAAPGLPLTHVVDLALPGRSTRLDYQTLDPRKQLLFIAHLGDSTIVAVDTRTRRVVATIPKVSQVHGVLAIPELNVVYATATGTNEVVAIDESSFKIVARTRTGVYPDGIAYDPGTARLFVSDEHGRTETVIDTASNRRVATIRLGGEAGNSQFDPASQQVFVNVQTLGQLVEIDPTRLVITRRISLSASGCIGNHGLLIDPQARRAFIACQNSSKLLLLDMRNARVVGIWSVGEIPDVVALDSRTHRLFVAAESGVVTVFSNGRNVTRTAEGFLAPAAHTVAVDSRSHVVYFPLENVGGKPVLRIMKQQEQGS
jgi:DNA-binding beta-propeller fold protein YncE